MSAGHRFDCTLTIATTAFCNTCCIVFLGRGKVLLRFCQAVVKFRQKSQSDMKHAYYEGCCTETFMFLQTTFFIVLPPLKRYFSCASTVTNMRDSSSSTYDCLRIVSCSQFLGVVTIGQLLVVVFFAKLLFSGSSQLDCMLEMCS